MSEYATGGCVVMDNPSYVNNIDYSNVRGNVLFDVYQRVLDIVLSVVGLLVGLFQATTQIQEMTLSFIPKIIITFLVILIMGQWMLTTLIEYTRELLSLISTLGQIK